MDKSKQGDKFNGNKYLSHIEKWNTINDTIIWFVDFPENGKLQLKPILKLNQSQINAQFEVIVGEHNIVVTISNNDITDGFKPLNFKVRSGQVAIAFVLKKVNKDQELGQVIGAELTGKTIKAAKIIRTRWRPAAIHAKMMNSSHPRGVRIVVVEDMPITKDVWIYHPITTPFGYTGVSWDETKQQFGGINFSLWSYSAKGPVPPREQWSQLISVGKGLEISGFGHEGTGVKPRGMNPYDGISTDKAVVAIRMEPGIPYNTYYAYYLDPTTEKDWILFGSGKQYNKQNKLGDLWTGKFVEVIGPPEIGRTGHRQRVVAMKGWCVTESGEILPLDELHYSGNNEPEFTSKEWTVKEDKFYMKTGGFRGGKVRKGYVTKTIKEDIPYYLSEDKIKQLYVLPAQIENPQTKIK